MIVTHSAMECFKACRMKYKLRYVDCIVPKVKFAALEFGSAMHEVLETYFKRLQTIQNESLPFDEIEELSESLCSGIDSAKLGVIDTAKLSGLVMGYLSRWYDVDKSGYDVIDVEREFCERHSCKNSSFVNILGKADGLLRRKLDGKYFILEHKTASIVDDSYISQKSFDTQTMTYAICLQNALGIEISGAIHDIIIKQKIKQKKGESWQEFCDRLIEDVTDDNFIRIIVEFNDGDLENARNELSAVCDDIANCSTFYKCTGNCLSKYGACEYLQICKLGQNFATYSDMYEQRRPHEELSEGIIESTEDKQ